MTSDSWLREGSRWSWVLRGASCICSTTAVSVSPSLFSSDSVVHLPMVLSEMEKVKMFVVDEADEMLKEGFLEGLHTIFNACPKDVQVIFLSATMPAEMLEVTNQIMMNPIKILVKSEQLTLEGITQFYIMLEADVSSLSAPLSSHTDCPLCSGLEVRHPLRHLRHREHFEGRDLLWSQEESRGLEG